MRAKADRPNWKNAMVYSDDPPRYYLDQLMRKLKVENLRAYLSEPEAKAIAKSVIEKTR